MRPRTRRPRNSDLASLGGRPFVGAVHRLRGRPQRAWGDVLKKVSDESTAESEGLAEAIRELGIKFPDLPDSVIAEHVHRAHARLAGAPVRDYVPVLVQRQARVTPHQSGEQHGNDALNRPAVDRSTTEPLRRPASVHTGPQTLRHLGDRRDIGSSHHARRPCRRSGRRRCRTGVCGRTAISTRRPGHPGRRHDRRREQPAGPSHTPAILTTNDVSMLIDSGRGHWAALILAVRPCPPRVRS